MDNQSNEILIAKNLTALVSEGGDDAFLIISSGEYYVQFVREHLDGKSWVVFEIVSNMSIPGIISESQESQIRFLGFEATDSNFSREYQITGSDSYTEIARTVSKVFTDIFCLPFDSPLEIELEFQN